MPEPTTIALCFVQLVDKDLIGGFDRKEWGDGKQKQGKVFHGDLLTDHPVNGAKAVPHAGRIGVEARETAWAKG